MKKEKVMDWTTFIGAIIVLLFAAIPMMVFPKASETVITDINSAISNSIGSVYLFMGLAIFCFALYVAFGKYGNVTLGKATDKPEFNNFTWVVVLFCAGIGSDILHWGAIEWAFYHQVPPDDIKSMSNQEFRHVTQYSMFHWGSITWTIYVLPVLPIGYLVFAKKKPVYKINQACRPILKGHTDKLLGKIVDILFIFGLFGGVATSLALGAPMILAGTERLTSLDGSNMTLRSIILLTTTVILAISPYTGLKRGIQKLSDINVWLSSSLLAFVFIVGPTVFIMETTVIRFGNMIKDSFHMVTWMEPFGGIKGRKETNFS